LKADSGAGEGRLEQVHSALGQVKTALGVSPAPQWGGRYYQITNRPAFLWYIRERDIGAWLLSVYFIGDHFDKGRWTFPTM
jgi:hypothetical protein